MSDVTHTESDRTAYQTLSDADLGSGAVVAIGHATQHISRETHAPEKVTAFRFEPNGDYDSPRDTLILRHDTQDVEIEHRTLDRDSDEMITELSPVTNESVRVVESADEDPDETGFNPPGFTSASEVGR
ncbi:hypothetical protein [Halorubrum sp. GN11GM_10-3_MGM]|uniref:hypothetical protein n=1 Tax=Halorubrum sp. GN11GM_10-3_MGM TaxID=2518111 RepID=UPI0010F60FD3|nr:hypothetical protein [Halorubrum sp. GN11GM_10-3_MGM]TKX72178.1 hypothetical protein EXE40_04870 [Halorubrum sp. GN11GM_10-3_MGM]